MQATDPDKIAAGKTDEELMTMLRRPNDWQSVVLDAVRLELQRRNLPLPADITAADAAQQQLDREIDTLLRNTHHAWQTVETPKVDVNNDRNLSVDAFIAAYRSNRLELLKSFCTQFGPVLEGEFFITYAYSQRAASSQWPVFFLTNERLVVWDNERLDYSVVPLGSCVSFSRRNLGAPLLETKDGSTSDIFRNCPFRPDEFKITVINSTILWANSMPGESRRGLEIQFPDGRVMIFPAAEVLREPILRGEIPRSASVKILAPASSGTATSGKASAPPKVQTVESWAKSNEKLRPLYAPIWAMTLKGALWGAVAVGILKTVDTAVSFFRVNPPLALLWLWLGALIGSPKWKRLILSVGVMVLLVEKDSINFGALFSMIYPLSAGWFGILAFAAVFGVSAGMPVGTIVGTIRARGAQCAPDREGEGTKPLVWGLLVPVAVFATALIVYLRVLMPYFVRNLSHS